MEDAFRAYKIQSRQLKTGINVYNLTGSGDQLSHSSAQQAKQILIESSRRELYKIPEHNQNAPKSRTKYAGSLQPMQYELSSFKNEPNSVLVSGWAYPSFSASAHLEILLVVESRGEKIYFHTAPYLGEQVLMGRSDLSFFIILDKSRVDVDWTKVNIGLALSDPIRGIVAETFIELEK